MIPDGCAWSFGSATRGLTDFTGTMGGIKSRLMRAGCNVRLVGSLRYRWSAAVSEPLLSPGTALNLPADIPEAGLQSYLMPVKSKLSLSIAGKSLGVHFYGMVWEAASTESPWPWGRAPAGAELLLSPFVPRQGRVTCFAPSPSHSICQLRAGKRRPLPTSPCPHPGLLPAPTQAL